MFHYLKIYFEKEHMVKKSWSQLEWKYVNFCQAERFH